MGSEHAAHVRLLGSDRADLRRLSRVAREIARRLHGIGVQLRNGRLLQADEDLHLRVPVAQGLIDALLWAGASRVMPSAAPNATANSFRLKADATRPPTFPCDSDI